MSNRPGYIYKLTCGDKFYFGSTQMTLETRRYFHIQNAKCSKYKEKRKIFQAINAVPEESVKIECLEEYETIPKAELLQRENTLIREHIHNPLCVNTSRPIGLSPAEWRAANRQKVRDSQNTKFDCPCSGHYTRANRSFHTKTKKHLEWLKNQTPAAPQPQVC